MQQSGLQMFQVEGDLHVSQTSRIHTVHYGEKTMNVKSTFVCLQENSPEHP